MSEETQELIRQVCNNLADWLCAKNESYGDSAVNPRRIRSTASAIEQIRVRQDDKLNRLLKGNNSNSEDDLKDLVGYWVLEQVALATAQKEQLMEDLMKEPIGVHPLFPRQGFVPASIWPQEDMPCTCSAESKTCACKEAKCIDNCLQCPNVNCPRRFDYGG